MKIVTIATIRTRQDDECGRTAEITIEATENDGGVRIMQDSDIIVINRKDLADLRVALEAVQNHEI